MSGLRVRNEKLMISSLAWIVFNRSAQNRLLLRPLLQPLTRLHCLLTLSFSLSPQIALLSLVLSTHWSFATPLLSRPRVMGVAETRLKRQGLDCFVPVFRSLVQWALLLGRLVLEYPQASKPC